MTKKKHTRRSADLTKLKDVCIIPEMHEGIDGTDLVTKVAELKKMARDEYNLLCKTTTVEVDLPGGHKQKLTIIAAYSPKTK